MKICVVGAGGNAFAIACSDAPAQLGVQDVEAGRVRLHARVRGLYPAAHAPTDPAANSAGRAAARWP